ncbi:histidine kinase [Mesorhizobium sp. L-8-10]|nr:histidine kinase [Mesorhizobium sp. L-8-10]
MKIGTAVSKAMSNLENELLGTLPVAAYLTDAHGRITYCNDAAAKLLGYRPAPGTADSCDLWRMRFADGNSIADHEQPVATALGSHPSPAGCRVACERPDRSWGEFLVHSTPTRDPAGKVTGTINLLVDVSAHLQDHEEVHRLAAIVESSDDAIVSKDLSGFVKTWNAGAERLFGYRAEEIVGKHIGLLIPSDRQHEEELILSRVRRGERVEHFDTIRVRKDGAKLPISLTVSPIRNAAGAVIGASKIARDITERKESERRIQMLMREVDHRVKNQFAVILAMVRETGKSADDIAVFELQLRNRLIGLARSQDLLVRGGWKGAELGDLIDGQVRPFTEDSRIQVSGEPVTLSTKAVQNLGMAFHELATNSTKHGALSCKDGIVSIRWTAGERFRLTWQELGGPIVDTVSKGGFGRIVLERITPAALDGTAHLGFPPEGVIWTLDAPIEQIRGE